MNLRQPLIAMMLTGAVACDSDLDDLGGGPGEVPSLSTVTERVPLPDRGFTSISGASFLSPDSVLLTDRVEGIGVIDLASGEFHELGRRGEGPGEYSAASAVVPFDGKPAIHDRRLGRVLTTSFPGLTSRLLPQAARHLVIVGATATDFVFVQPPTLPAGLADSAALVSMPLSGGGLDTLGLIAQPRIQHTTSRDGTTVNHLIGHPLGAKDAVAMGFDGSLFVAYAGPGRICKVEMDGTSICAPLPSASRKVTSEDKEWAMTQLPEIFAALEGELDWPMTTPPFGVLLPSPAGQVLLESTPVSAGVNRKALVIDENLIVTHAVLLGSGDHLLAFAFPKVLVYREDSLGLQHLRVLTISG